MGDGPRLKQAVLETRAWSWTSTRVYGRSVRVFLRSLSSSLDGDGYCAEAGLVAGLSLSGQRQRLRPERRGEQACEGSHPPAWSVTGVPMGIARGCTVCAVVTVAHADRLSGNVLTALLQSRDL